MNNFTLGAWHCHLDSSWLWTLSLVLESCALLALYSTVCNLPQPGHPKGHFVLLIYLWLDINLASMAPTLDLFVFLIVVLTFLTRLFTSVWMNVHLLCHYFEEERCQIVQWRRLLLLTLYYRVIFSQSSKWLNFIVSPHTQLPLVLCHCCCCLAISIFSSVSWLADVTLRFRDYMASLCRSVCS